MYGPVLSTYTIHLIHNKEIYGYTLLHRPLQYSSPVHCELINLKMTYDNQKHVHSPHPSPTLHTGHLPQPSRGITMHPVGACT